MSLLTAASRQQGSRMSLYPVTQQAEHCHLRSESVEHESGVQAAVGDMNYVSLGHEFINK